MQSVDELKQRILSNPAQREPFLTKEEAYSILNADPHSPGLEDLIEAAEIPRKKHFSNLVRIHILNNVKNGHCPEDCGYCAQRKTADGIVHYTMKPQQEILAEAKKARDNGAFRYCMVTAGTGPTLRQARSFAETIRKIKEDYGLEVCLSAGIVKDPEVATVLAAAGLDRYNHNINTSENHYGEICTTHTFADRVETLNLLKENGVELCSGVIAGMGESRQDLVDAAFQLSALKVVSIPVNFFLPVPGHALEKPEALSAADCLRILAVFRLVNPAAEIRMAAGREVFLKEKQSEGLRMANSLFVDGYLNVKGSNTERTLDLIRSSGYEIDPASDALIPASDFAAGVGSEASESGEIGSGSMKDRRDLRPFETVSSKN